MQTRLSSHHAHRTLVAVVLAAVATFGGALVLSLTSAAYAKHRVPANVTVAGLSVGAVALADARTALENAIASYEQRGLSIERGSETVALSLADVGLAIDVEATLAAAQAEQNERMLFGVFSLPSFRASHDLPLAVDVDQAVLERFLEEEALRGSTPPVNARLALANGRATVVPEKDGTRLTVTTSNADLVAAVSALRPIVIERTEEPWNATVRADDLRDAASMYATAVSAPITMTAGSRRWQLGVADLERYLVPATDGPEELAGADFAFAEHFVSSFLQPIVDAVHVAATPTFGYEGGVEGVYAYKNFLGRALDVDETMKRLLTAMRQPSPRSVELPIVEERPTVELRTVVAPKAEGKVIMVALEEQTLFAFEDGKLAYWTRISSGKAPRTTPTGEWKVYTKSRIQKMSGPGYYLPNVRWVLPYDGDYTIHGAYWHTNFGYPMSHGCTNMFDDDAKWVFDWAEVGTPVLVRGSAGV